MHLHILDANGLCVKMDKKQQNIAMETTQETEGSAVEQSAAYSHEHTTVRPIIGCCRHETVYTTVHDVHTVDR